MSTPNDERPEPTYGYNADRAGHSDNVDHLHHPPAQLPSYNVNNGAHAGRRSYELNRSGSDEEGTLHGDNEAVNPKSRASGFPRRTDTLLTVETQYDRNDDIRSQASPSQTREQARRLDDDLELLKIERQISRIEEREEEGGESMHRSRSRRRDEDLDEFDIATNPVHEKTQVYKPVENPSSSFAKFFKSVHKSNWLIRYFTYIAPLSLILLIPLLIGLFLFPNQKVGGVTMWWFMIWLEIVWLTLWLGRIIAKCLPWPIGIVSTLFTNNGKKWRDMGKQLEMPATLFFWGLAIEISFLPTMTSHMPDRLLPDGSKDRSATGWQKSMNKVLISFLVGVALNFVEKILIQLIAISFHLRTYADRIEINKFQIGSLIKLYIFSKTKIAMEDSEFEIADTNNNSGARTPGALISEAAKTTKEVVGKIGDVTGKIAGDFTGKTVYKSTHPNQVVITLLSTISGSQVLARRLYRTFARESTETVYQEDLHNAFENEDEATAAFSMFDKDMNGDISMEELEAVCVEIGRERKSITASLKDLDSVVSKLDDVFMFIVIVVVILVLISLISASAAGVLTSAGSAVLALSWLFSVTAQEFLQSVVFVFIKHPFDVGDRVGIYGNTGKTGLGDDYFVKEISLLYTEFKKMEGHVVQAPNSYLNTLFILNQRRSGGLAEAVTISIKFGTTLEQIENLRSKLLEFVKAEKREYQGNILTELKDIVDVHSMNLNVVFFYKSNWQNEGLRLARRNKFICALMVCIQELSIEGPYMRFPGQKQSFPMYLQNVPHINNPEMGTGGQPNNPAGFDPNAHQDEPFVAPAGESGAPGSRMRSGSILRNGSNMRKGGESLSAMNKRVDFSLGMKDCVYGDLSGDIDDDRQKNQMAAIHEATRSRERHAEAERRSQDMAKTTSRDHHGARSSMDSEASRRRASTHRNRFFNRTRTGTFGPDEASLMEGGMADIPEARSGNQTGNHSPDGHIDPRTGLVSSAAYRTTTNESDASYPTRQPMAPRIPTDVLPTSSSRPHGATVEDAPEHFQMSSRSATQDFEPKKYQMPGRSATQDFEMKKLS